MVDKKLTRMPARRSPLPQSSGASSWEGLEKDRLCRIRRAKFCFSDSKTVYPGSWVASEDLPRLDAWNQWAYLVTLRVLEFPALKHLHLDFSPMNLLVTQGVAVSMSRSFARVRLIMARYDPLHKIFVRTADLIDWRSKDFYVALVSTPSKRRLSNKAVLSR